MKSPQEQRLETLRQVRVILVRQMIDIGRVSIQLSSGHLLLRGTLCCLPGAGQLTPDGVMMLMKTLGRVSGVRRVETAFDNWRSCDEGRVWVELLEPVAPSAGGSVADHVSQVFKITIKEKSEGK
jgi:hypothetical protein